MIGDVTNVSYEQAVEVLRRYGTDVEKLQRVFGAAEVLLKKLEPVNPAGNQFGAELESLAAAVAAVVKKATASRV
jgi:hypothetical protein